MVFSPTKFVELCPKAVAAAGAGAAAEAAVAKAPAPKWYRSPLFLKMCLSGVLNGVEELVAQFLAIQQHHRRGRALNSGGTGAKERSHHLLQQPSNMKPGRALRLSVYGFCVSGALGHYLYSAVDALFRHRIMTPWVRLQQVAITNSVVVPIQILVYLYVIGRAIDGRSRSATLKNIRNRFLPLCYGCWKVLPPLQFFLFACVPAQFWMPILATVGFSFGVLLKLQASSPAAAGAGGAAGDAPVRNREKID